MKNESKCSRRSFLKATAAMGAALAVGPAVDKVEAASRAVTANGRKANMPEGTKSIAHRTLGTGTAAFEVSALGFGVMGMTYNRSQHPDKKTMHPPASRGRRPRRNPV